ncbi:Na+/H+ antiporter [Gynurincola endophyticus]|uniref:Na+/H+ antiporter n=1 Tax=Gynurincola endophyticus TaxID=2479004 RepID=UPI000F8C53FD|nr:Na+/H+ antiporter [Gynurincola endophyticus]
MHHDLLFVLVLLFGIFVLVMLAQQIRIAYPIFLVIAGLAISFVPAMPKVHLDPDLIFLIFLPPLLYEAAWYTSWNDFWKWRRPISLLAFGLVFFTSFVVAFSTSHLIPGFTLGLGFLLGGIVSPPDAIAATTVLKKLKVPKRLLTILEGESLVNDASSLIVFRFALAAVLTGTFEMHDAIGDFFWVTLMGIMVGIIGAFVFYLIHRYLPTTPQIDAAVTVMSPYALFMTAEVFEISGVMAVVTGGLIMSYHSHKAFRSGTSRINMQGVWSTLIFVLNALVFILIGLELPDIVQGLGESSIIEGVKYGLIISAIVIAVRFLWVYPITHIPRFFSATIRKEPSSGWKGPLIIGWAGMRGVVSLATALSVPLFLNDGTPFPHRNLILLITFVVIFITLVVQGLSLPLVIKLVKLEEIDPIEPSDIQQTKIQLSLNQLAIQYIDEKCTTLKEENELVDIYHKHLHESKATEHKRLTALLEDQYHPEEIQAYHRLLLEICKQQRELLFSMRRNKKFSDSEIRKAEEQVDLNELKITGLIH